MVWGTPAHLRQGRRRVSKMPPRRRNCDPSDDDDELDDDFLDDDSISESESSDSDNDQSDDPSEEFRLKLESVFDVFKNAVCNVLSDVATGSRSCQKKKKGKEHSSHRIDRISSSTRFNVKYFADLIKNLTDHQREVIKAHGFGSILEFDKCIVPKPFSRWIAQHVDVKLGDIVVSDTRSIQLSPESVYRVLGIPMGRREVVRDQKFGKKAFLEMMNITKSGRVKCFGDRLLQGGLNDDDIVRCFLVVALAYFLCPSTCLQISPYYLPPLFDVSKVAEWNWAKLVYDWLMKKIGQFQDRLKSSSHSSAAIGGCMYYLAVVYLDHLNFASRSIPPPTFPRINVWKADMIKEYSRMDRKRGCKNIYGERPFKPYSETCYAIADGGSAADQSQGAGNSKGAWGEDASFKHGLDSALKGSLPAKALDDITEIYAKYSRSLDINHQQNAQLAFFDVIKYMKGLSYNDKSGHSSERAHVDPHCSRDPQFEDFDNNVDNGGRSGRNDSDMNRGDTELLSSSSNDTAMRSVGATVDTVILPSNDGTQSQDVRSVDVDHTKRTTSNAENFSNSQTTSPSPELKKMVTKRRRLIKNVHRTPTSTLAGKHYLDDDDVDSTQAFDVAGPHEDLNKKRKFRVVESASTKGKKAKSDTAFQNIDFVSSSQNSIGTRTRSHSDATLGPDCLEKFLKTARTMKRLSKPIEKGPASSDFGVADDVGRSGNAQDKAQSKHGDGGVQGEDTTGAHVVPDVDVAKPAKPHDKASSNDVVDDIGEAAKANVEAKHCGAEKRSAAPLSFDAPSFSLGIEFDSSQTTNDGHGHHGTPGAPTKARCPGKSDTAGPSRVFDSRINDDMLPCPKPLCMVAPDSDPFYLDTKDEVDDCNTEFCTPERDTSPDIVITGVRQSDGLSNYERCEKMKFKHSSTSDRRMPIHRARRLRVPCSYLRDFETGVSRTYYGVHFIQRVFFLSIMDLADDVLYKDRPIIDYEGVVVKFGSLATSMKKNADELFSHFVMNAFCRKLSLDSPAKTSLKHYFFSTVGDYLMGNLSPNVASSTRKSFQVAQRSYPLKQSAMLYFPIFHLEHWFVFVVDIRDGFFVFMDCFYDENSKYHKDIKKDIIKNFVKAWDKFIGEPCSFESFVVHYPVVPKHEHLDPTVKSSFFHRSDDGIFSMKYIETWDPYKNMLCQFSHKNIPELRVLYSNEMVLSKFNKLHDVKEQLQEMSMARAVIKG